MTRIIFLDSGPHLVTAAVPVSIPIARELNGRPVYGTAQCTALEVRPATVKEFNEWRNAK